MAYSSVRVQFEIGHEASIRTKKTPEGFTHDWEVFVRGADNTDIQCFVDKVVFHLHETFPKPRRVIKEPPYVVKESGYAGFVLPIDVYLKNKEEPKKISFQYDLQLQPSGPPISRVLREPRLFQNPSEDFRRKLIRGGGVGVDTPASEIHGDDLKSSSLIVAHKSKVAESPIKKHKLELAPNDSFAELFGTPIRRVPEAKKTPPEKPKKFTESDPSKNKKKAPKYGGSYKDEKEKYGEKEKNKEREKNKEKPSHRPPSPPIPVPQVLKSKDEHRKHEERRREEHDEKKRKKEEKEKREKTKDVKDINKIPLEKEHKKEKKDGKEADLAKRGIPSKPYEMGKPHYEKHNDEAAEKSAERPEKEKHKHRHKKKEKEKSKEKEKHRKERDKSERESREREKTSKKKADESREKEEKSKGRKSTSPMPVQERIKKKPLNALLDELGSSDSASPLTEDEAIPSFKLLSKPPAKTVPEPKPQPLAASANPKVQSTNSSLVPAESKPERESEKTPSETTGEAAGLVAKSKKEKSPSKKNKKIDREAEKRRGKDEGRPRSPSSELEDEEADKGRQPQVREERERSEKERADEDRPKSNKSKENRKRKRERSEEKHSRGKKTGNQESQPAAAAVVPSRSASTPVDLSDGIEDMRRSDKFTKEYVAQLRDLQHRIMSLEDNAELQKVVKVIAETGQYEITKKTFDFDLCALDSETVKRLQEFFVPT